MKTRLTASARPSNRLTVGLASAALAAGLMMASANTAWASDLVYKPINPGFGGNPFNSAYLLGTADRQNKFKDGGNNGGTNDSAGAQLVRNIERMIISEKSAQIEADLNDPKFKQDTYTVGDETVQITRYKRLGFTRITITNNETGEVSEVEVSNDGLFTGKDLSQSTPSIY